MGSVTNFKTTITRQAPLILVIVLAGVSSWLWLRPQHAPSSAACRLQAWQNTQVWVCNTVEQYLTLSGDHQLVLLKVNDQVLRVELVTTPASISQGLSGRSAIGSDGMLFVFQPARQVEFWMPQMQFALDLLWIRQGKLIGVNAQVPFPDPSTPLSELPRYPSPGEVDLVLEVEAGTAAQAGWAPQQQVKLLTSDDLDLSG